MKIFLPVLLIFSSLFTSAQDYCDMDRFDTFVFDSVSIEVTSNVLYGAGLNNIDNLQNLYLDVYRPSSLVDDLLKRPTVFFVHGGGLVGGSKNSDGSEELGYFYARMGYTFVTIDYRLGWNKGDSEDGCGGDTVDLNRATYRAVQDVRAAYRYIKAEADSFGIDTTAIFAEANSAGSRLLFLAFYADQNYYDQQFYDELGSIDTADNDLGNYHFNPRALITEAGGVEDTSLFYNNMTIPHLFFHGTCDSIVPFFSGPAFFCYEPFSYPVLHGSWEIVQLMKKMDRTYQFYIAEGAGHDAVIPDTIILYAPPFIKDILCNSLTTKEFYRILGKFKCAVQGEGEIFISNVYPNPVSDNITFTITSSTHHDATLDVYNALGAEVGSEQFDFFPPIQTYVLDLSFLARGIYYMQIAQKQDVFVVKFVKQ